MSRCTSYGRTHGGTHTNSPDSNNYSSWRKLLELPPTRHDFRVIQLLWTGAMRILDNEGEEISQILAHDLVNPAMFGYRHIEAVLDIFHTQHTVVQYAQSFLLVISHTALLDCLSIKAYVNDLYRVINGKSRERAVLYFTQFCNALLEEFSTLHYTEIEIFSVQESICAVTIALCQAIRCDQQVIFGEMIPGLLALIERIVLLARIPEESRSYCFIMNRVHRLQRMLCRLGAVNSLGGAISAEPNTRSFGSFEQYDRPDITKVEILPTYADIRRTTSKTLPSTDFHKPYTLEGVEQLLDVHFRLLRHDCLGVLENQLKRLLGVLRNDPNFEFKSSDNLEEDKADFFVYNNVQIRNLLFSQSRGLETQLSFRQPQRWSKQSLHKRDNWGKDRRPMQEGTLICLITHHIKMQSILFFTISRDIAAIKRSQGHSSNHQHVTITAKLAQVESQKGVDQLLQLIWQRKDVRSILVEFPGVLLTTFVPVLKNLQHMQFECWLPFQQWIVPQSCPKSSLPTVPPPLYARDTGFFFNLRAVLINNAEDYQLSPNSWRNDSTTLRLLESRMALDQDQCQAIIAALTQEFTLIQGPPGTGKSYVGLELVKVLLDNKQRAQLGPIIVVCHTNHALDQFLERLVNDGINNVIRIGGQSKSAILARKNLRLQSQSQAKTTIEKGILRNIFLNSEENEETIASKLRLLRDVRNLEWDGIKIHLLRNHPHVYTQFERVSNGNLNPGSGRDAFTHWRTKSSYETVKEPVEEMETLLKRANQDIHQLLIPERHRLLKYWMKQIFSQIGKELFGLLNADNERKQNLSNVYGEIDRRCLQNADVIGVTTAGFAHRISVLRHVKAKVTICEEAGQVLEGHLLSALLPSLEHLIQIGDHTQLRPPINDFRLSLEGPYGRLYQLDRSMFERVSKQGRIPLSQLNVQRRMRPEISKLLKGTIYPRLVDHESVRNLPDVVGMRRNVFWLHHTNLENRSKANDTRKSYSNPWEVKMIHALVQHIVRQGVYGCGDITILTPYTEQLQNLKEKLGKDFNIFSAQNYQQFLPDVSKSSKNEGENDVPDQRSLSKPIRISTIDDFQGEEAKIIIFSLVRSNNTRNVGFLRSMNRINVLLSRSQHGLYIIGNADIADSVPMWSKVIKMLRSTDSISPSLSLCCPRHPNVIMEVSRPEDFEIVSPEGGCTAICNRLVLKHVRFIYGTVTKVLDQYIAATIHVQVDVTRTIFIQPSIVLSRVIVDEEAAPSS